jgi:CubicO group peptidase (beta-lactamase class C family)
VVAAFREARDLDGVLQVRLNGTVVYELAAGTADEEFSAPMATDSIFPIGSNSKLFTAVALYQLQERGLVNVSDPVNQYLNQDDFANFGFPNQTTWCPRVQGAPADSPCENITFVQLMHMGSGIADSLNCDNVVDAAHCYKTAENLAYYKGSLAAFVGLFINDALVFKPDTNYSYSNPNYNLLSYMVEKISGKRFEDYLQKMIVEKIGLPDTYYDPYSGGLGIRPRYVQQYTHYYAHASSNKYGELLATGTCSPYINSGATSGSGGFRSSVPDMQRWYLDLFGNRGMTSKVLTPASIRMILERVNPVYPVYGQGIAVWASSSNDTHPWPSAVSYCGGLKCAVTCMNMQFPTSANGTDSVVFSAFSNHMHMGFRDRAAFEAFRPSDMFMMPPPDATSYDDGGASTLVTALVEAYKTTV